MPDYLIKTYLVLLCISHTVCKSHDIYVIINGIYRKSSLTDTKLRQPAHLLTQLRALCQDFGYLSVSLDQTFGIQFAILFSIETEVITMNSMDIYKTTNHFMTYNSIEPVSADSDRSEVRTFLSENSLNMKGFAHGGLIMTLADCAAGLAARCDGRDYVTQNMNVNFISNIKEGTICARGTVIHRGRTVVSVRVAITDEKGKLLADATANMFCISVR